MKKVHVFLLFLICGVVFSMNSVEANAATKEHTIQVYGTVGEGSVTYDLCEKWGELIWFKDKITGVTSSNPSVVSVEADEERSYRVFAKVKSGNFGKYDLAFDYKDDHYVIHLNVAVKKIKKTSQKNLYVKGKKVALADVLPIDEYNDEVLTVSSSASNIVGVNKKNYQLKKTGTAVISYAFATQDEDYEPSLQDYLSDEYGIYVEGELNVQVLGVNEVKKDAVKKANAFLAKRSAKEKIAYVDLNFDGIKEIVANKKLYSYNISKAKYERFSLSYTGNVDKIYIAKSKRKIMLTFKGNLKYKYEYDNGIQYYDIYKIDSNCEYGDVGTYASNIPSKTRKLYKISSKYKYGMMRFPYEEEGILTVSGISKTKFNKATKTGMAGKKLVKTYTNTAKNRKKIVK